MRKNENKRDNFFILTNVINVSKQYSGDFNRRLDILDSNANAGGIVVFKSYNLKNLMKKYFIIVF